MATPDPGCPFCDSPVMHSPVACPAGITSRPRPDEVTVVGDPGPARTRLLEGHDETAAPRGAVLGGEAKPMPPPSEGRAAYLKYCEEIAGEIWGRCKTPLGLNAFRQGRVVHSGDVALQLHRDGWIPSGDDGAMVVRDACQMLESHGIIRVTVRGRDDSFCFVLTEKGAKRGRVE